MFLVSAFYHLTPLAPESLSPLKDWLQSAAIDNDVLGLITLSPEGINATVAAEGPKLRKYTTAIAEKLFLSQLSEKLSESKIKPFRKFVVKIREEIVTSEFATAAGVLNEEGKACLLNPKDWQELLLSGEEITLLDTRNSYEYKIGKFKGAIDCGTTQFTQFPNFIKKSDLPRDRKTLIYCTGGIRCEKALHELKAEGFKEVFHLGGGILKYLEEFPNSEFIGECFVFDDRVSLTQKLEPTSRYKFCESCGDPRELNKERCESCGLGGIT